jgi:hypothetical protein
MQRLSSTLQVSTCVLKEGGGGWGGGFVLGTGAGVGERGGVQCAQGVCACVCVFFFGGGDNRRSGQRRQDYTRQLILEDCVVLRGLIAVKFPRGMCSDDDARRGHAAQMELRRNEQTPRTTMFMPAFQCARAHRP